MSNSQICERKIANCMAVSLLEYPAQTIQAATIDVLDAWMCGRNTVRADALYEGQDYGYNDMVGVIKLRNKSIGEGAQLPRATADCIDFVEVTVKRAMKEHGTMKVCPHTSMSTTGGLKTRLCRDMHNVGILVHYRVGKLWAGKIKVLG